MTSIRSCLACVAAALLVLLSACGKNEADTLAAAKAYIDKREFNAAQIELKNWLQSEPSSGGARFLLGRTMLELGDAAGAEAELERALEFQHPEEAVAPVMAKALLAQRKYRKLSDRYGKFEVADFDGASDLKTSLALALAAENRKDEARVMIDRALQIKPDSVDAQVTKARLLASEADIDGALKVLDAALAKAPTAASAWVLKGDILMRTKSDLAGADAAYRKAIEARKDSPEAYSALISMAMQQKDVPAAAKLVTDLKAILPNHPQTRFFEAQVAFGQGEFTRARELLQPLMRVMPEHVGVLHLAGATEFRLNSIAPAETYLSKAVQLAPNFVGARRVLAQVYLRQRQPSKVQAILKPILDKADVDSESLSMMAQALVMLGDNQGADEYFSRAAKLKPDDRRIKAAQALGMISKGQSDAGFVELETLAAADKGSAVDMALISAHLRRNEFDQALKAIALLEKKQPDSPVAPNLRGRIQMQQKDMTGARQSFETALQRDPKFVPAAGALAALDLAASQPEAAKQRFTAVLKADPKNSQAMMAMGELATRTGAPTEQATKWFTDAVAADVLNPTVRLVLIDHLLKLRDMKSALAAAQAAVAAIPDNIELIDKLARIQLNSGDSQQAMSNFTKVTQLKPDAVAGFVALAEAQLATNDVEGAARNARSAYELAPAVPAVQRLAIATAMRQKRAKDALVIARDMQKRQPADPAGLLYIGEIELDQKNNDAAIAAFRAATALPKPGQAPTRLHNALLVAKRDAEASKFVDSWLAAHPKDTLFMFYLGDLALGQGDTAAAELRYGEVLKVQPEHALALNNVAWLMVQQKRSGAVAVAERAVKAAPNQPPLMDTLALALAAEAQLPRALEVQKKVVQMAPDAPSFRLNLAKFQLQAGDKSGALAELDVLTKLGAKYKGSQEELTQLIKAAGG